VSDRQHLMPLDEYMNPRAQELAGHLNLLEEIDFRVSSEHVAGRFRELLGRIREEDPAAARQAGAGQDAGSLAG
jgi:hypothetical protein